MKSHLLLVSLLSFLLFSLLPTAFGHVVSAEDAGDSPFETKEEISGLPSYVPPPHFARFKHPLPDLLLLEKRQGWYITPVPLIGIDPDTGFNFGVGADLYNNGKKDSPFFRITPYRQKISAQVLATTKKIFQIGLSYDQPYILDTPWRVRAKVDIFYNPVKLYFGTGDDSLTLVNPRTGVTYGSYNAYKNSLKDSVGGTTYTKYDEYGYSKVGFAGSAEYDLLGGLIRPLIGLNISRIWIDDYTGNIVKGSVEEPTHLRDDCNAGRVKGCRGGFDNYIKLGVSFDTRNFEPDPLTGILFELVGELSPKYFGSAYNYGRLTSSLKGFGKILKYKKQQIVLAGRFVYNWQFGSVPFYSMNVLGFTEEDRTGLGGIKSLRGYKLDRFIGPVAMLTNLELRWSFIEFTVFKQYIKLMAVPFFDAGRVFNSNNDITFKDWKIGGGGGIHLAWNLSTVVSLDYGVSGEGQAFYMELAHQF